MQAALDDASGMVDAACFHAGRYTSDELSALTGNSAALLKRLVCDLAFTLLRRRRGFDKEDLSEFEQAEKYLERLRLGERVFDVAANIAAGNPVVTSISFTVEQQQNTVRQVASRFFPTEPRPIG